MSQAPIDALEALLRDVVDAQGFCLRSVQLQSHRIPLTLQVVVQRGDGGDISLDECASLSGPLGDALDASDVLPDAYVLEISSPGIGEELSSDRDFRSFRGFPVAVRHRDAKGAEQRSEGLLLGRDDEAVQLNLRGRPKRIQRADVISIRLITPQSDN